MSSYATSKRPQSRPVITLLWVKHWSSIKGVIAKWVVATDWPRAGNPSIVEKGRKKHSTENVKSCSAQNTKNYVVSKAWYLIRGWSLFPEHIVRGTEPSLWCFVPLQSAQALALCIFRCWARLCLSAHVTGTGKCTSSGTFLWNTSFLGQICLLNGQNRNQHGTNPKCPWDPFLKDLVAMHLSYLARPPTCARWNDMLNVLRRLRPLSLCRMSCIPSKVSTLLLCHSDTVSKARFIVVL